MGFELGLILFLGSVFQNPGELVVVEHATLDGSLAVHLVNLLIGKPITHRCQKFTKVIFMQDALVVLVEAAERVLDHILWIGSLKALAEQRQEHGEVDGAGRLVHHALQVLVGWVLAEGGQHVMQVLLVDEPVPVLVDHVERLLELLDLVLVEHGEHIRGRPLCPLLGRATTAGRFTGRHCAWFFDFTLKENAKRR